MFDFYVWSRNLVLALAIVSGEGAVVNAQDFFGWKPQWLHRNDVDYAEPIRTYADGYNVAKVEQRPLMILVTQKVCPPCRVAKKLLEDMRSEHALGDCVLVEIQASDVEARGLMVGKQLSPQLIVLDIANIGKNNAASRYALEKITRDNIGMMLAQLPEKIANPTVLEEFVEAIDPPTFGDSQAFGATVITFHIATEYKQGYYNGTFAFGDCEYMLNGLGRYLNVTFKRTNRGQFSIVQSSRNGPPGAAAWTNGNVIRISPTFRFVNPIQCGMVTVHEFLHFNNGTSHHAQDGGIMGPNGGYLLLASDFPWMQKRGWKNEQRQNNSQSRL